MVKVLIVDDEEHVREAIEYLVDWEKFKIKERFFAGSVDEAEEIIKAHKPEILLCDMKMPEKSGVDLIESVKLAHRDMQIIVISGHDDFEYMRAVIQAKAVDYILKPIRKQELEAAIESAVKNWKELSLSKEWLELVDREKPETKKTDVIQEIKTYIDHHFKEKITLDILAKTFYVTPPYISGRFKEMFGMTVIDYVTSLKIKNAKYLLLETNMPVIEIAYELGFSNENYFSKVFKKYEGLSPKNFREKK
ncbi:response regulator transcription factor [Fredinandcohnia onubensis]|uniref:response regulator transcription factor n=1 Tax=Fredinandcohnia onubensis TaxID=1571209 RepID=UPI0015D4F79B|nr:response regulator [Fredinandcohnia onubensis]